MRDSMEIAKLGGSKEWSVNEDNYTVPIAMRHINKTVADLYAKNPTAQAKRRKRLDATLWDGKPESYLQAAEMAMAGDPNAMALLAEVERSEEHTSELQSLMRISYAVFCLKKKQHTSKIIQKEKHTID